MPAFLKGLDEVEFSLGKDAGKDGEVPGPDCFGDGAGGKTAPSRATRMSQEINKKSTKRTREKKRLEHVLSTDSDLARRGDDIAAYFDLAKEGENVDGDLQREISALRELLDRLETESKTTN